MIDDLVRDADPAAGLNPDPASTAATTLLRDVLATRRPGRFRAVPRGAIVPRSRAARITVGAVLAGAAAAAAVVVALPGNAGPRYSSAAYTVDLRSDGSVRIVLHWSELQDVQKLQAALDRAHARTVVLAGDAVVNAPVPATPACARAGHGSGPYSARAVQWDFPNAATEVNGIVIRPQYFPADGTFVIELSYVPGTHDLAGTLSFMARGRVPTCVQPIGSTGPLGGGPTGGAAH